jgi:hypothetical protein
MAKAGKSAHGGGILAKCQRRKSEMAEMKKYLSAI